MLKQSMSVWVVNIPWEGYKIRLSMLENIVFCRYTRCRAVKNWAFKKCFKIEVVKNVFFYEKIQIIWHRKLAVRFLHFLTTRHYVYHQNTIIFITYVTWNLDIPYCYIMNMYLSLGFVYKTNSFIILGTWQGVWRWPRGNGNSWFWCRSFFYEITRVTNQNT